MSVSLISFAQRERGLIKPYVQPDVGSVAKELLDPSVSPVIEQSQIDSIINDKEKCKTLARLVTVERRHIEIDDMLEFLGNDQVIALIKDIVSVFYGPLMRAFQNTDLSSLIDLTKDTLRNIIIIAENRTLHPSEILSSYERLLHKIQPSLYSICRTIILNDHEGFIDSLMAYLLRIIDLSKKKAISSELVCRVNTNLLYSTLLEDQKIQLVKELEIIKDRNQLRCQQRKLRIKKLRSTITGKEDAADQLMNPIFEEYYDQGDIEELTEFSLSLGVEFSNREDLDKRQGFDDEDKEEETFDVPQQQQQQPDSLKEETPVIDQDPVMPMESESSRPPGESLDDISVTSSIEEKNPLNDFEDPCKDLVVIPQLQSFFTR